MRWLHEYIIYEYIIIIIIIVIVIVVIIKRGLMRSKWMRG